MFREYNTLKSSTRPRALLPTGQLAPYPIYLPAHLIVLFQFIPVFCDNAEITIAMPLIRLLKLGLTQPRDLITNREILAD